MASSLSQTVHLLTGPTLAARLRRPAWLLFTAWLLTLIAIPILRWIVGDSILAQGVIAGVLLQSAAVLAFCLQAWGMGATVRVALSVVVLS